MCVCVCVRMFACVILRLNYLKSEYKFQMDIAEELKCLLEYRWKLINSLGDYL